ncbi:MAG: UbiD family decarboxylase [Chloroflexota bacterium]
MTTAKQRKSVGYNSMREYMDILAKNGLLKHISAPVELDYEVGAISYRDLIRNGPGLIFDNIRGYEGVPLVTNIMYSLEQLALAFNAERDWVKLEEIVHWGMKNRMPAKVVKDAPVQEVKITGEDVDVFKFPTPLWHELDGGRYIATTAGVITKDPKTGAHNMGQYRSMIIDRNHITVKIQGDFKVGAPPPAGSNYGGAGDRSGAVHVLENEAKGLNTPCAVALGMDPLLVLAAGTAVPEDEKGLAEYDAAGAWAGRPVELVKCETVDLLVPAQAEIILEGEIVAGERHYDGPHGESSGFYNKNYEVFVMRIDAITHRTNPYSYGLICGRIEDYPRPLMRSGSILDTLVRKTGYKNIKEVYFPDAGAKGVIIIRAKIESAEQPLKILQDAWEHLGYRWVIVVDEDADVHDWNDIWWRIVSFADPEKQVVLGKELPRPLGRPGEMDFIPPKRGIGIDATRDHKVAEYPFPPASKPTMEILNKVGQRWPELGL